MVEKTATINTVLQELREFRTENNKRWEQNEKRWEENNKRWEQNEKRWEENDKKLETINERVTKIENTRESDKKEFARVFEAMEEAITGQFDKLNEKIDIKFSKADAIFADLGLDVKELQHTARRYGNKINLHDIRIEKLEDWKDELDVGGFVHA